MTSLNIFQVYYTLAFLNLKFWCNWVIYILQSSILVFTISYSIIYFFADHTFWLNILALYPQHLLLQILSMFWNWKKSKLAYDLGKSSQFFLKGGGIQVYLFFKLLWPVNEFTTKSDAESLSLQWKSLMTFLPWSGYI